MANTTSARFRCTSLVIALALTLALSACGGPAPTPTPLPTSTPAATATPNAQALDDAYVKKFDAWAENYSTAISALTRISSELTDGTSYFTDDAWQKRAKDVLAQFKVTDADVLAYKNPPAGYEDIQNDVVKEAHEFEDMLGELDHALSVPDSRQWAGSILYHMDNTKPLIDDAQGKLELANAKSNLNK